SSCFTFVPTLPSAKGDVEPDHGRIIRGRPYSKRVRLFRLWLLCNARANCCRAGLTALGSRTDDAAVEGLDLDDGCTRQVFRWGESSGSQKLPDVSFWAAAPPTKRPRRERKSRPSFHPTGHWGTVRDYTFQCRRTDFV